MKRPVL